MFHSSDDTVVVGDDDLPVITALAELTDIVADDPQVYLRLSNGPRVDAEKARPGTMKRI